METKDLLGKGYHQMKLRVDPFERGAESSRTKSEEITKILHRSPDLVILGEIQSEEHSRAFFHALTAGVRGLQTFHASSAGQAIRRWREMHGISKTSLLDLDIIVQMSRPDRLESQAAGPGRGPGGRGGRRAEAARGLHQGEGSAAPADNPLGEAADTQALGDQAKHSWRSWSCSSGRSRRRSWR